MFNQLYLFPNKLHLLGNKYLRPGVFARTKSYRTIDIESINKLFSDAEPG